MRFELTKDDLKRLAKWVKKQDKAYYKEQLKVIPKDDPIREFLKDGQPYYGAVGGSLTYSFTPTSVGTVVKVRHAGTKEIFDLTDYASW